MSAWSNIWKCVVYLRLALRIECRGDHLWRTVDRSLPRLTGALLRAWLRLRHGAFWGSAPAPLTKLDLIDLMATIIPTSQISEENKVYYEIVIYNLLILLIKCFKIIHISRNIDIIRYNYSQHCTTFQTNSVRCQDINNDISFSTYCDWNLKVSTTMVNHGNQYYQFNLLEWKVSHSECSFIYVSI